MKNIKVIVGTKSPVKLEAVSKAVSNVWFDGIIDYVDVKGWDVSSGVNAQPVGNETLQGAVNRLVAVKKSATENNHDYDIAISIENGIFKVDTIGIDYFDNNTDSDSCDKETYLDYAYIVVEDLKNNIKIIQTSAGIEFPYSAVNKAREIGFDKKTAGDIMPQLYNTEITKIDSKDPHHYLLDYYTNRTKILQDALELSFARLRSKQTTKLSN